MSSQAYSYESYPYWVQDIEEFTPRTAKLFLQKYNNMYEHQSRNKELLKDISTVLSKAYLDTVLCSSLVDNLDEDIKGTMGQLSEELSADQRDGLKHVVDVMKMDRAVNIKAFYDLSDEAKIFVLSLKEDFLGLLSNDKLRNKKRLQIYNQLVRLEPNNYHWHLGIFKSENALRLYDYWPGSTKAQKHAAVTAFELCPEKETCLVAYCQCLAYLVKERCPTLKLGRIHFRTPEEAVHFIIENSMIILVKNTATTTVIKNIQRIFTCILPRWFQINNKHISNACWMKILERDPESSIGLYMRAMTYFLNGQYERALKDFKRTIELGSDYGSRVNYVKLLMRNPIENKDEIEKIFQEIIPAGQIPCKLIWTGSNIYIMYITQGYYLLMIGKNNEAILSFVGAYNMNCKTLLRNTEHFKFLQRDIKKYGWSTDNISLIKVKGAIQNAFMSRQEGNRNQRFPLRKVMLDDVTKCIIYANRFV